MIYSWNTLLIGTSIAGRLKINTSLSKETRKWSGYKYLLWCLGRDSGATLKLLPWSSPLHPTTQSPWTFIYWYLHYVQGWTGAGGWGMDRHREQSVQIVLVCQVVSSIPQLIPKASNENFKENHQQKLKAPAKKQLAIWAVKESWKKISRERAGEMVRRLSSHNVSGQRCRHLWK